MARLGHYRLQASEDELRAALRGALTPLRAHLLGMYLDHIELLDVQIERLDQKVAAALSGQQEAVLRLAKVPGLGAASGDV